MKQLHILKFDYSEMRLSLDGYLGYFIIDGVKVDRRTLSNDEIKNLMMEECEYYVPLIVKNVDSFNKNDKIVYTASPEQQYICICDDDGFLNEVNQNPHNHLLIIVDEEDSSTMDSLFKK